MANLLKIKALCKERKLYVGKLAEMVDITPNAMHKLIRNGSTNTTTLEKIAKVLNVPVTTFFDDGDTLSTLEVPEILKNALHMPSFDALMDLIQSQQRTIENLTDLLKSKPK